MPKFTKGTKDEKVLQSSSRFKKVQNGTFGCGYSWQKQFSSIYLSFFDYTVICCKSV